MSAATSRPSGLKQPSKIGKPAAVVKPSTTAGQPALNNITRHPATRLGKDGDDLDKMAEPPLPLSMPMPMHMHMPILQSAIFTSEDLPKRKKVSDASTILTENTDDFIIGDRVWVGGTKPGHIQYIGETQFAPGDWGGVVLDEAVGKNDGSVAGVRYFQCEPRRGVFSRLTKLTKEPVQHLIDEEMEAEVARVNGRDSPLSSSRLCKPSPASSLTNLRKVGTSTSPHGSSHNLSSAGTTPTSPEATLRVGERVVIHSTSGSKIGILRYLGATDFAVGDWAGVELSEPQGKNDGSVGAKRYFDCQMKYGLFAPVHKVTKAPPSSKRMPAAATPSSRQAASNNATSHMSRRAGSRESLNSSISSASSLSRAARVRLGVNSLTAAVQKTPPVRSPGMGISAAHSALQEALKEKEQHIEQLLRERDLERAEVARASVYVEEAEREKESLRAEHLKFAEDNERTHAKLRDIAETADRQRSQIALQLEEERRRIEDLQFRLEEEVITKSDLESQTEADAERVRQLEQTLRDERARTDRLETDCHKTFQSEETVAKLTDEVEHLRGRLSIAESRIRLLDSGKEEVAAEVASREVRIAELDYTLEVKEREAADMRKRLGHLEEALEHSKQQHLALESRFSEANSKVEASDKAASEFVQTLQALKLNCADLERKVEASEQRSEQLNQQKLKLAEDLTDFIKSKDNSIDEQLSKMNEAMRGKERRGEELQGQLQESSQEVSRLKDALAEAIEQSTQDKAILSDKHREAAFSLRNQIHNLNGDVQRAHEKIEQMRLLHEQEEKVLTQRRDEEVGLLKREMESSGSQLKALKQQLDAKSQTADSTRQNLEQQLRQLLVEKDRLQTDKEQAQKEVVDSGGRLRDLQNQMSLLDFQRKEQEVAVIERDAKLVALTAETERLRVEFGNHRLELQRKLAETQLETQAMQDMHNQLDAQNRLIEELQRRFHDSENDRELLESEIAKLKMLQSENLQSESATSANMKKQLEEMKERECRTRLEFEEAKKELHLQLQSTLAASEKKEKDLDHQQKELMVLRRDSVDAITCKSAIDVLETEKTQLQRKVVELQVALECKQSNQKVSPIVDAQQREETSSAEAQIEFLNTVIVDMQKKNDDLQSRIHLLEAGPLLTDDDINLNGFSSTLRPPRLYCDICELFDLHDTEDCPQQASSNSPPPSQYRGSRSQVRSYCDTCEVFGHWTNQCDDNETF